jgi:hypothetical protein
MPAAYRNRQLIQWEIVRAVLRDRPEGSPFQTPARLADGLGLESGPARLPERAPRSEHVRRLGPPHPDCIQPGLRLLKISSHKWQGLSTLCAMKLSR